MIKREKDRKSWRQWYYKNREKVNAEVSLGLKNRIIENRNKLKDYFLKHPCVDCGEPDIVVLEFDHRPGTDKKKDVSELLQQGSGWNQIFTEIVKCDVVCANCHRRRTYTRVKSWRIF